MKVESGKLSSRIQLPGVILVSLLLLIHLFILWLMLSRRLDPLFNDAKHRLGPGTDFAAYYTAGLGVLEGKGAYGHGPGFGFRYHPLFAAIIGGLFGNMGLAAAYWIWIILNEIGLFWLGGRLWSMCSSQRQFLLLSLLLVFFTPYYLEVYMGNATFLCSVMLFKAITLMNELKHSKAALILGASIVLKPVGLVLLPWLAAVRGRWKDTCLVALVVVVSAFPFFWKHGDWFRQFLTLNFAAVPSAGWVVHGGNQGFHVFLVNLCTRVAGIPVGRLSSYADLPQGCQYMIHAIPVIFAGITLAATLKRKRQTYLAAFLWLSTYLLGYKDIWEHSYSLAIVTLLLAWMSGALPKGLLIVSSVFVALPTAFVLYDIQLPPGPIDPERFWSNSISFLHHSSKWIWIALPYGYAITNLLFRKKASENALGTF